MMMDFYEMTMSYGYFHQGRGDVCVAFDLFFRAVPDKGGYAVFAGLEHVIEFVENLSFSDEDIDYFRAQNLFSEEFLSFLRGFRFRGDIYAVPEGTIIYPDEPLMTIVAPIIDAQLIETAVLAQINHQSLIATKASRIVRAAEGRMVSDFGARRAHNMDAATYGARAAYIGGVDMTATVSAGQQFGIPISGTMAHSWVMFFEDEFTAFKKYAELYPQATVLLVDTYDVIHSGIPNAIRTAHEVLAPQGHRLAGVRIDSGDLAYLSKRIRTMLDDAGLADCKIILSNSLDDTSLLTDDVLKDSLSRAPISNIVVSDAAQGPTNYEFDVPVRDKSDAYNRAMIRFEECYQSLRIVYQALDLLDASQGEPVMVADKKIAWPARLSIATDGQGTAPEHVREIMAESMEALIHHFKLVTEGFRVPAGQAFAMVEHAKGVWGCHIVSSGGTRPYRVHVCDPGFHNLQGLSMMAEGGLLADAIVCLASIDPVMGGVDR